MFTGRVVGEIWATKRHPTLEGFKLLLVDPYEVSERALGGKKQGLVVAADAVDAGVGDDVIVAFGHAARVALEQAEGALDHLHRGAHRGLLERDVGHAVDRDAGGDLDVERGLAAHRQVPARRARHEAGELRLHAVEEGEGAELDHGSLGSGAGIRRGMSGCGPKARSTTCTAGRTEVFLSAMSVTRLIAMPGAIST